MANTIKFPQMAKVLCNMKAPDIRLRQPKTPGQKAVYVYTVPQNVSATGKAITYNVPQTLMPDAAEVVWANETNIGHRCTRCGSTLHPYAK